MMVDCNCVYKDSGI